ncbi:heterokaryon incompatibility protein-domain-containing protein [Cercophora newfieldiana]|uniref:Heterokaryon incompatibility protein-domain-containing protein n=1 Tax=Cercophora newfieldiana TaxID=92897 RepID=A0AA40CLR9_9PEZI|nr:heterokaryon incompatibility protein-domain-containing protein [Cercophora newfieldiana]
MSPAQRETKPKRRAAPSLAQRRAPRDADASAHQPLSPPPLDLNDRQIRILRLLPAPSWTDPIRCTLFTAYLDKNPFYEALSYAWGDPAVTRQVFLDGRVVNVTENLAAALRRLRRRFGDRRLWVDALCINQQDNNEKSHQVNLMKDIYAKAPKAILWLGDFSDGPFISTSKAAGAPPNPSAAMTRTEVITAFRALRRFASDNPEACRKEMRQTELFTDDEVEAVTQLLQLPWWTRIWTVQETVLAKRPTLMCGTMQIPFQMLLRASSNVEGHYAETCCKQPASRQRLMMGLREKTSPLRSTNWSEIDLGPDNFVHALNMFRYREASDPRDRVFALLGLGATITADYSLTWKEVFISCVRQQIVDTGQLVFLKRIEERNRCPDLPTWTPDWCASTVWNLDGAAGWLDLYDYFKAAGETVAKLENCHSSSVIQLQGYLVDRVSTVGDRFSAMDEIDNVVDQWKALMAGSPTCPYEQGYDDAFWRLMTCDVVLADQVDLTGYHSRRAAAADEAHVRKFWEAPGYQRQEPPMALGLRVFMTQDGKIGLGGSDMMVGDVVSVLLGGQMPFILRPTGNDSAFYQLIGEVYVHGIMDGEVTREGRDVEWVSLV